jgi:hypothetical protein
MGDGSRPRHTRPVQDRDIEPGIRGSHITAIMPIDETAEQCLPICLGMILGYSGSQLKAGTLKHIEARYQKPSRGSGELTSLYFY